MSKKHKQLYLDVFVTEQTARVTCSLPKPYRGPKRRLMMSITLTDSQQCVLTVKAKDKKQNPTTVAAGSVSWFVDNTDLLSITDNNDGTATLVAVGPLGSGTVSVKATVDGVDVAGSTDVTIISGAPTQLTVEAGALTEQP